MGLKQVYTYQLTREAIERADGQNINKFRLVRNDISNQDFNKKDIKQVNRNQSIPEEFRYPGKKDEGHVFRHVEGTHKAGKSIYKDQHTAICVTMQLLNSTQGQKALEKLEAETRDLYDNQAKRITAPVSGTWYGKASDGTAYQVVETATCEILKLGNLLWVHSSYPRKFRAASLAPTNTSTTTA